MKNISGHSTQTVLKIDIRDFDKQGYQQRKEFLQKLTESYKTLWGEETIEIKLTDSYENAANNLEGDASFPVDIAREAYERNGITMKAVPMRGGYDGAILPQNGLPCPNIFTGAHNFHSIYEYLPVDSLKAASKVAVDIIRITAEKTAK